MTARLTSEASPESFLHGTKVASLDAYWDFVLAVVLFIPTIALVPGNSLFAIAIAVFALRWVKTGVQLAPVDLLFGLFLVAVYCNLLITLSISSTYPSLRDVAIPLMFVAVLVGRSITPGCANWLVVLIAIEALVCIAERLFDVPALLPTQRGLDSLRAYQPWRHYLYFYRVLGLSTNSSIVAEKLLLGLLLLHKGSWRRSIRVVLYACLAGGFYATFNRTALSAAGIFIVLVIFQRIVRSGFSARTLMITAGFVLVLVAGLLIFYQPIFEQFQRGVQVGLLEDSGRKELFADAFQVWKEHPLRGNGSIRYEAGLFGSLTHVHNSFLETLATHGSTAVLLWLYVIAQIDRRNWPYAVALLMNSMFQYCLFWNISLADIILYHLLWSTSALAERPVDTLGASPVRRSTWRTFGFGIRFAWPASSHFTW